VVGFCEHGNERSVSVTDRAFLGSLSEHWLLKEDSAPWSDLVESVLLIKEATISQSPHFKTKLPLVCMYPNAIHSSVVGLYTKSV
jgi:hypothetical protein